MPVKQPPSEEASDTVLTVSLPAELAARLERIAAELGLTASELLRMVVCQEVQCLEGSAPRENRSCVGNTHGRDELEKKS